MFESQSIVCDSSKVDHRITLDDNQLWELRKAIIEKVSDMMLWEEYLEEQREWNDYLNHDDERY